MGTLEGCALVELHAPGSEPATFPATDPDAAARLVSGIYLREAGWALVVRDAAGTIIARRDGPDPVPTRVIRRGGRS